MERIIITIETDGPAFEKSPEAELAKILQGLARSCQKGTLGDETSIADTAGNECGSIQID